MLIYIFFNLIIVLTVSADPNRVSIRSTSDVLDDTNTATSHAEVGGDGSKVCDYRGLSNGGIPLPILVVSVTIVVVVIIIAITTILVVIFCLRSRKQRYVECLLCK